jgi:succinyl-diaminopimelate desuccinylase
MDYLSVARDLIALNTTVPPGLNYEKAIDYLLPLFAEAGFSAQKIEIPVEHAEGRTGRFALIAHHKAPDKPHLIFYAHIDVVPAEGWNAFKPEVRDGRIYGRGAADMKGGLVALLLSLDSLKNAKLQYDVSVMVTTDEEYSQALQLRYLAKFVEPVAGSYVFSLDSSFGFVNIASLGLLQMNIVIKGKSVHSGLAHLGVNAVEKAIPLLDALLNLKKTVTARKSEIRVDRSTGLTHMEGRLNINMIHGGIKTNIVPDECHISIDRRLIPEEKLEDAERELMDTLKSVPGLEWEIEQVFRIPAVLPCHNESVEKLEKIIKDVTGKSGRFGEMGSGDLSAIVCNEWGGQDFGIGVIRTESNIHGKNEFAYLKDIEDLSIIISRFLTQ